MKILAFSWNCHKMQYLTWFYVQLMVPKIQMSNRWRRWPIPTSYGVMTSNERILRRFRIKTSKSKFQNAYLRRFKPRILAVGISFKNGSSAHECCISDHQLINLWVIKIQVSLPSRFWFNTSTHCFFIISYKTVCISSSRLLLHWWTKFRINVRQKQNSTWRFVFLVISHKATAWLVLILMQTNVAEFERFLMLQLKRRNDSKLHEL